MSSEKEGQLIWKYEKRTASLYLDANEVCSSPWLLTFCSTCIITTVGFFLFKIGTHEHQQNIYPFIHCFASKSSLLSFPELSVVPTTSGSISSQTVGSSSSSSSHHASTSELNDAPGPSTSCSGSVPENMHTQRPSGSNRTATEGKTENGTVKPVVGAFLTFTFFISLLIMVKMVYIEQSLQKHHYLYLSFITYFVQMITDPACQAQPGRTQAQPCPDSHPAVSSTPRVGGLPLVTCPWATPILAACRPHPLNRPVALSTATVMSTATATLTTSSTTFTTQHRSLPAPCLSRSPAAPWSGPPLCLQRVLESAAATVVAAAIQDITMTR